MAKQRTNRTGMVMDTIRQKIAGRLLEPGDRLPSIRKFATTLQVSPSTVVEAFDRLAAEGLIRSRPGSGFFVSKTAQAPLTLTELGPKLDQAIDPFWVSRQSLDASAEVLKPGCGWLPAEWMPNTAMRRAIRQLARADDAVLTDYGSTRGASNLRLLLARQFADEGLMVGPDQVLLAGSGTQSIDLICRFLLRPGDTVLVDDPCYFNFQALLRAHQVRIVGVPLTTCGPDLSAFSRVLTEEKPRLYITNSALHNPTGATLSPQTAHQILKLSAEHNLTIVEDDIFAAFEPEVSPRLATLDGLERVIRIGSFSKTLSASIRCGYIAAKPEWIDALVDLQVATNFGGPSPFAAELVHSILVDGSFRKHMEAIRTRLDRQLRQTAADLKKLGFQPWLMPRGGFYLWCRLPEDQDASALAQAALRENVILAPGNVFSISQSMQSFVRFNVSQMDDEKIFDVMGRAMQPKSVDAPKPPGHGS